MIWAILAALEIPLWLCALGALTIVFNNRRLRKRHGDIPVRVLRPGKKRWTRGHAVWVSDVFAWRGSPAAWNEDLLQVSAVTPRPASPEVQKKLHRLADDPAIMSLSLAGNQTVEVAVALERREELLGPFKAMRRPGPRAHDRNGASVEHSGR